MMNKAVDIVYSLNDIEQVREAARIREKALHDEASALAPARNEGRTEERNALIERMHKRA